LLLLLSLVMVQWNRVGTHGSRPLSLGQRMMMLLLWDVLLADGEIGWILIDVLKF
jgi:hypothetical protein